MEDGSGGKELRRGEEGRREGVLLMKLTGWLYEELAFNFSFIYQSLTLCKIVSDKQIFGGIDRNA